MAQQAKKANKSYFDNLGNEVVLTSEIARGGEGVIYNIKNKSDVVAKIYFEEKLKNGDRKNKVSVLCEISANSGITNFSALPQKMLYNSKGKFVGFIMKKIANSKELHLLYGMTSKKKHFDFADWGFMVRAAKNLACAFDELHSRNIIMGDINERNIFVDSQAMIKLVDCDSYQVEYKNKIYNCAVGVAPYTPYELIGEKFDKVARTKNHDCFGLAVLIFQTLLFGEHPFFYRGDVEKIIKKGFYGYGKNPKSTKKIHLMLVSKLFNDEIKELFERAFEKSYDTKRPNALEWIEALDRLESSLTKCSCGHIYLNNEPHCVWCDLASKGFDPFDVGYKEQTPKYKQTLYKAQVSASTNHQISNTQTYNLNKTYNPPKSSNGFLKFLGVIVLISLIISSCNKEDEYVAPKQETPQIQQTQTREIQEVSSQFELSEEFSEYLKHATEVIKENYSSFKPAKLGVKYMVDATVEFNPKTGAKLIDNIQNGEIAEEYLQEFIGVFDYACVDYREDIIPLIVKFRGYDVASVDFKRYPIKVVELQVEPIKKEIEKVKEKQAETPKKVESQVKKEVKKDIIKPTPQKTTPEVKKVEPPKKVKTDLEKSSDYFFE